MSTAQVLESISWVSLTEYGSKLGGGAGIYIIRKVGCPRVYIGSTGWFGQRINEHRSMLLLGKHPNKKLSSVFGKYGFGNMEMGILEARADNLPQRETYWISFFDSYRNGLNQTPSGDGAGKKHDPETIARIQKARAWYRPTEATKARISEASKRQSRESRMQGADKRRGRKRSPGSIAKTVQAHLGSKRSPESLARISESVSKLTRGQVLQIREMLASGTPAYRIASQFGVCKQTVCNIRHGKSHSHIKAVA